MPQRSFERKSNDRPSRHDDRRDARRSDSHAARTSFKPEWKDRPRRQDERRETRRGDRQATGSSWGDRQRPDIRKAWRNEPRREKPQEPRREKPHGDPLRSELERSSRDAARSERQAWPGKKNVPRDRGSKRTWSHHEPRRGGRERNQEPAPHEPPRPPGPTREPAPSESPAPTPPPRPSEPEVPPPGPPERGIMRRPFQGRRRK
jgi:hypothetical protein